jgi:DNA-binding PadR family transcriptional regulator
MGASQEHVEAIGDHKLDDTQFSGLDRIIDIQLLYLVHKGPVSGYDLRRNMQKRFNVRLSYGIIYPHLRNFERRNFVFGNWSTSTNGRSKKKFYTITQNEEATLRGCLSTFAIMKEQLAVQGLH